MAEPVNRIHFDFMPELIFSEYTNQPFDSKAISLMKINRNVTTGGGGGGSGGAGIVGTGSPEGVQTAPIGTSYFDSNTNAFWYKRTGAGATGWIEVLGP